ncbi:MAG TPA: M15 family metallopeptidase [Candidatus Binatia bacterium]|nr:M15 family metallopeptidase [Candidatus Binatia bacterium]
MARVSTAAAVGGRAVLVALLAPGTIPARPAPALAAPSPASEVRTTPAARASAGGGLVDVGALLPDVRVELKYATDDNFLGRNVYGELRACRLVGDAAEKLVRARSLLRERAPDLTLVLYDCGRPRHVQVEMWRLVAGTPKEPYVANPHVPPGSVHNTGCAVDLSLARLASGEALDMGTPFDFFGPLAEPQQEIAFWQKGELSSEQLANRLLLREVMLRAGFRVRPNEWWHFDCADPERARELYPTIE